MKLIILFALVACVTASGWHKAKPRDMSKYKTLDVRVPATPNNMRTASKRLANKNKPVKSQVLPETFDAGCGHAGKGVAPHIVGGSEAKPHQFPWQVGIFVGENYLCGGSVISDEYILTAAHCVDGYSTFNVVVGAHEIMNPDEEGRFQTAATAVFVHPRWDAMTLTNNVAILKVDRIELNEYVSPVCLPSRSDAEETFEGETMTVSGWGRESDSSPGIAKFLNFVSAPVISNAECDAAYGIVGYGVICISTEGGKGPCAGDSGGPLVMLTEGGSYVQHGIHSFVAGVGCEAGFPAGFTRVTSYLDFISGITGIVIP